MGLFKIWSLSGLDPLLSCLTSLVIDSTVHVIYGGRGGSSAAEWLHVTKERGEGGEGEESALEAED